MRSLFQLVREVVQCWPSMADLNDVDTSDGLLEAAYGDQGRESPYAAVKGERLRHLDQ
jgi:hypothetical protein